MLNEGSGGQPSSNGKTAGFFDVDGTLGSTNVVQAYLDFRRQGYSLLQRWTQAALFLPKVPYYLILDALSRERFCEVFFHSYAEVHESDLEQWASGAAQRYWHPRLFPEALLQLEMHRAQGHRIVLVSGGIEPVLKPLAEMLAVDALIAAQPEVEDTRFTGRLVDGPLSGKRKADAMHHAGDSLGIDLEQSYAYADSYADREFLECVAHPVAVNPDRRLRRVAQRRGWSIRTWRHR